MYVRVLQDELQFPEDRAIDQDTKSLIRGVSCVLCTCAIVELMVCAIAAAEESCIEDLRTENQTTSLFLYDVRVLPIAYKVV